MRVDGKCGNQIDTKFAVCLESENKNCPANYLKLKTEDGTCRIDEVCCFVRPKIDLKVSEL